MLRIRLHIPLLALAATLAASTSASASIALGPDRPAATPVARAGTPAASTRALSAAQLRDRIAGAMADAGGSSGTWVSDINAEGNGLLYSENAANDRIPASNQKLFTTAALLDELGGAGHLTTRAYASGDLGGPAESVLKGDLVLVGDGDPAFGTARFARANDQPVTRVANLARDLARGGLKKVTGKILADDSIFDRVRRDGPYLSPLSGLSFNNGYDGGDYASDPELLAARALKTALRARGVSVAGQIGRANLTPAQLDQEPLGSVASPTVARLIEETNVPSNNFFAEMLLKRLAATTGKRGTRDRGAALVEQFAGDAGATVNASDGSGLSRKNSASPEDVGKLLVAVARDGEDAAPMRDSLPVAGREGTLANRMRGTAAEGNCAAKTGTLSEVSALSGYCDAGGHTIAFSILMNDVSVDAAHDAQDEIAAAIARYRP